MAHQFEIAVDYRVSTTDDGTAEEPCKYTESTVTGGYDGQRSCFLGEHYRCFQGLAAEAQGRTWEIVQFFAHLPFHLELLELLDGYHVAALAQQVGDWPISEWPVPGDGIGHGVRGF